MKSEIANIGRQLCSSKGIQDDSADDLIDKIWSQLEFKLNGWIEKTLSNVAETVINAKVQEIIATQVEKYISSETLKSSLVESIDFDVKYLQEEVKRVNSKMAELEAKNQNLEAKVDHLEQYTRRTNLRIFGIEEQIGEDTDHLVKKFCKDEFGIVLKNEDISRSHQISPKGMKSAIRPRPIIIRLTQHNKKVEILKKRRSLRDRKSRYTIQEDLTETRRSILRTLRDENEDDISIV